MWTEVKEAPAPLDIPTSAIKGWLFLLENGDENSISVFLPCLKLVHYDGPGEKIAAAVLDP